MEDSLDVVPVRVEQKGPVVTGVILRPLARGSVVSVAGCDTFFVEGINLFTVRCRKGDVHSARIGLLAEAAGRSFKKLQRGAEFLQANKLLITYRKGF